MNGLKGFNQVGRQSGSFWPLQSESVCGLTFFNVHRHVHGKLQLKTIKTMICGFFGFMRKKSIWWVLCTVTFYRVARWKMIVFAGSRLPLSFFLCTCFGHSAILGRGRLIPFIIHHVILGAQWKTTHFGRVAFGFRALPKSTWVIRWGGGRSCGGRTRELHGR